METTRRPLPPAEAPPVEAVAPDADATAVVETAAPGVLAKLGQVLPAAESIVRFVYRMATVSAVAAAVVVLALIDLFPAAAASVSLWWLVLAYLVLVIPAGATALLGWTLSDLMKLPGQIREAALSAARGAAQGVSDVAKAPRKSRLVSVFRAIWAARGLAMGPRDVLTKTLAAARFVRLASLPFVLALVALFVVNGAVIVLGALGLLVLLF
jgi:hypothetical protein